MARDHASPSGMPPGMSCEIVRTQQVIIMEHNTYHADVIAVEEDFGKLGCRAGVVAVIDG